jgi:hypothetical protein
MPPNFISRIPCSDHIMHEALQMKGKLQARTEMIENELKEQWRLHHMPTWAMDNEFIISSYRKPGHSILSAVGSMFYLHNETFNVWTHLLGGIVMITLAVKGLEIFETVQPREDELLAWYVFLTSALYCMFSSSGFHLLRQTNSTVYRIGMCESSTYFAYIFVCMNWMPCC